MTGDTSPSRIALVTGGTGFVGTHLCARLAADGWSVVAADIAPEQRDLPRGVEAVPLDVVDEGAVSALVTRVRPDVIFHLAARASVPVSMRMPVEDVEANVRGTIQVARAAIAAGTRRIVFFSTGGALFGEPRYLPVDEDHLIEPVSVYGISKAAAEQYLRVLTQGTRTTVSVLRPGNVYGPGQDPKGEAGVVAIFTDSILSGRAPTIYGTGSQERDYIYVDDVIEAAMQAAVGEAATCQVATGIGTSTRAIHDLIAAVVGWEQPPTIEPERPGDIQRIALSPARARERWGWEPRVALDEGIRRTVEWFRARA